MSDPSSPQGPALEGSVRDTGEAIVGLVSTRIQLLGVELQEEALHLQQLLVQGVIAAFLLGGALVLAGALVAAAFWDSHRLLALGLIAAVYGIAGTVLLLRLRSSFQRRPPPFSATVSEFEADLRAFRGRP
jgi:uncharacterized membrane protein YqjE